MKVYPDPLVIDDKEGFSPQKDLFGRAELGMGMSHLVATVENPLVIAFDGQWGSGKTTFLKMWAGELRKSGHPVIFFDAFENDYIEDAFAALAREIVGLAEELAPQSDEIVKTVRETATNLGKQLLKGAAKLGAKVTVRAATAGLAKVEVLQEIADDLRDEMEDAAAAYMEELLDSPKKQKQISESFRQALSDLPALLAPAKEGEKQKPLIFILDELDRCKPHFALALLERIKHFMSVPNVHFVLGVHLKQLQASVRYAYGESIDASAYLQKFINLTVLNTKNTEYENQTDIHKYAQYLATCLNIRAHSDSPLQASSKTIIRLTQAEQMSFRTVERCFTNLALAIGMTPQDKLQLGAMMGGLIMMKILNPALFIKAKKGTLTLQEAQNFLRFEADQTKPENMSWEEGWWTYVLSEETPDHLKNYGQSIARYHFGEKADILKYMANEVVDRLKPS